MIHTLLAEAWYWRPEALSALMLLTLWEAVNPRHGKDPATCPVCIRKERAEGNSQVG